LPNEAMPRVKEKGAAGQVSVEYRNYVLNHYDWPPPS
jgi:hypothetical protein